MILRLAWLALLSLPSLLSAAEPAVEDIPSSRLVAFVGRLESIAENKADPCAGDPTCVMLDVIYDASYTVLEPLQGRIERGRIRFRIFDHSGFPGFARYRHALLFVLMTDKSAVLVKYQGFEMQPLAQGGWGSCGGDPSGRSALNLQPLQFAPEVNFGSVARLTDAAITEEFDPDYYDIRGGLAYCRKGVTAEALAKALYPKLLQDLRAHHVEDAE